MAISERYDFRGGYATDLVPERMDGNMLLEGSNLYYKGKIQSRPSWENVSTDATVHGASAMRGFTRAYINGAWYNIVALDDGSYVNFYYGNSGTSYTAIDGDYDWTKSVQVEMAVLNNMVIAVNGTDKPAIIYYDDGWVIENLEAYDARVRGTDEWFAGQYDDSETDKYIDDTEDAQSDTEDDFAIATATNNDGFYVACTSVFNKIVMYGCQDLGTTVVAAYEYYAGDGTWTAVTPGTTPAWTGAEATKTIEFNLPLDTDGTLLWQKYGDLDSQTDAVDSNGDSVPGALINNYVFRVRFTTADTAGNCDYIEVSHTQYLTQIFLNDKPNAVCVHKDRVFLAAGNAFRYSPPNQVTEWNSRDIEYCDEGGKKILQMVSCGDFLAIFKEAAIYRYLGTTTNNFVLRHSIEPGAVSQRGACAIRGEAVYVSKDGIRITANGSSQSVSRHIQSDMDSWTKTDAVALEWNGDILISFPTNDKMLWADPDTLRKDEMGDGRLSFWEWDNLAADQMVYANGNGDSGYLIAHDKDNKRFVKNGTNGYDLDYAAAQTAITQTFQSKYDSYGTPSTKKAWKRVKIDMSESGTTTATLYANNGDASASKIMETGGGSGHHSEDISVPYTLDGYNLSLKIVNATSNNLEIYGFTTEYERRAF